MTTRPTPRPALRKAPDSGIHPAEPRAGVVPLHADPAVAAPADREAPAAPSRGTPAPRSSIRSTLGLRRPLVTPPAEERDLRRRRGSTTSDALRGTSRDKLVDAGVRIPRSLRKKFRQEAKRRGVSPDELMALMLSDYLED